MTMPSEAAEQEALVSWFDMTFPEYSGRLVASMNGAWVGGGRNRFALIAKYKRGGMRNGYPDLMLPIPAGGYHGLFIELKRVKGGRVSPEQKDWLAFLSSQGYRAEVCNGAAEAIAVIDSYLESYSQN